MGVRTVRELEGERRGEDKGEIIGDAAGATNEASDSSFSGK